MRMWLHLGTALSLLIGILCMVYFVAGQIARPLRKLARVMETVRRTGDHSLRASWNSQDEIGRLVLGFNGMLDLETISGPEALENPQMRELVTALQT